MTEPPDMSLPWRMRAVPYVWLALATVLLALEAFAGWHVDTPALIGCLVMAKLADKDNVDHRARIVFAWQLDNIARKVWRP